MPGLTHACMFSRQPPIMFRAVIYPSRVGASLMYALQQEVGRGLRSKSFRNGPMSCSTPTLCHELDQHCVVTPKKVNRLPLQYWFPRNRLHASANAQDVLIHFSSIEAAQQTQHRPTQPLTLTPTRTQTEIFWPTHGPKRRLERRFVQKSAPATRAVVGQSGDGPARYSLQTRPPNKRLRTYIHMYGTTRFLVARSL